MPLCPAFIRHVPGAPVPSFRSWAGRKRRRCAPGGAGCILRGTPTPVQTGAEYRRWAAPAAAAQRPRYRSLPRASLHAAVRWHALGAQP